MALVSFIIPYYNAGAYLPENLQSIFDHGGVDDKEIIIIDDGSTDEDSLQYLDTISEDSRFIIIRQSNLGPAAARNAGIQKSTGDFVFFLDSDNRLRKDYIGKALKVMEKDAGIGVVYAQPFFFGADMPARFTPQEHDPSTLIHENYIDMCSMVRRAVFDEVGLLDESGVMIGFEDWEFWLKVTRSTWKFFYIKEPMFDYRLRAASMTDQVKNTEAYDAAMRYIFLKHAVLFHDSYLLYKKQYRIYEYDRLHPFRSFLKYIMYKSKT